MDTPLSGCGTPARRRRGLPTAVATAVLALAVAAPASAVVPNDRIFPNQYYLHNTGQTVNGVAGIVDADIDAPDAWDVTTGSAAVKVAMVDDGVDPLQNDLAPNLTAGYDFGNGDADPTEAESRHGSQTASIVGSRGNNGIGMAGVAWNVSLMELKVRKDGPGERFDLITPDAVAAAFRYAGAHGARVANASFGFRATVTSTQLAPVKAALEASPNTLFVVSAGNSATNNDASPRYPCNFDVPNLLCVAGTDQRDALWSSSSYGATSVDLAAPASSVWTISGRNIYGYVSGTSYAAPQVTGVAALYFARYPSATVADVKNALLRGVDVLPSLQAKVVSNGRLNAARTLAIPPQSQADTTPPPAPSVAPASGTYGSAQQVTMADAEAGAAIRYTVGAGSTVPADPTATTGAAYTGPISVGSSQVIKVAAFDAAGNRSAITQRTYTISASSPPQTATRTVTLNAVADTMAKQASASVAFAAANPLQNVSAPTSASSVQTYLRFDVPALAAGERIAKAELSLAVTDATTNGPQVWRTATTWTEGGLTWNTRPSRTSSAAVANFAAMPLGRAITEVSGVSSGAVSFQLYPEATDALAFASREDGGAATARDPQLVLTITTA